MYKLSIVDTNGDTVFNRIFIYQKDIIEFTKGKITYNDFKPRTHEKIYKTYKNFFILQKN
jgi:hypothetical protein